MSRRRLLQVGLHASAALGAGAALLPALAAPARAAADITSGSFISAARGGIPTGWKIARPPGVDWPLRPVIMLHGRDENADRTIYWGYERMLGDLVAAGAPPFAVAAIDGGNSYWHPHHNGDDPGAMIINEFIPMLASQEGLDVSRVAFMGWSAGGYGALLNGARLGSPRTAAIAAVSPSLWMTYPEATADAFDNEHNWAENTVFGLPQLNGIPLWVSTGFDDRFYVASKIFAEKQPAPPAGGFGPGAHEGGYWLSQVPLALSWIAPILAG